MRAGFYVNNKVICPGIFKFFSKVARFQYHQVHIAGFGSGFAKELNDHWTKADIGNKTAVHYVEVVPVGNAFIEHLTFVFHFKEVGRKKGRGNNGHQGLFCAAR